MPSPFHVERVWKWVAEVAPMPHKICPTEDEDDGPEDHCEATELPGWQDYAESRKHKDADKNTLGSAETGCQTREREIQQVTRVSLSCEHASLRQQPRDSYGQ